MIEENQEVMIRLNLNNPSSTESTKENRLTKSRPKRALDISIAGIASGFTELIFNVILSLPEILIDIIEELFNGNNES